MEQSIKYRLRWVAVLPGAIAAGILVTFPLHWFLYLIFAHEGTFLGFIGLPPGANIPIERAVSPFVIAITFILVGAEIAPTHKFRTAIGLAILYALFAVGTWILASTYDLQPFLEFRSIGLIAGLILGLYLVWRKSRQGGRESL